MISSKHPSGLQESTIEALRTGARSAAEHAYAPYSKFRVGAALLLDGSRSDGPGSDGPGSDGPGSDIIVTGCNVENASYRLTTCAEQTAIVSAVVSHGPGIRIRAIAIANLNQTRIVPCGACRQTIQEFSTPETWLLMSEEGDVYRDVPFADLLPMAFRLEHLNP